MDVVPFVRLGLVMIRPSVLVFTVPLFGGRFAPTHVRIGLALLIGVALAPVVPLPTAEAGLLVTVAREVAIGMALSLAVAGVVAAAELAGYLVGFQAGFSIAAAIDPQSGVRNNIVASLYGMLTLFTLFLMNGHHAVLRALAESYQVLPMGTGGVGSSLVEAVMEVLGLVFRVGLQLAAPVIVALLVVELALGLIARSAPAMNLMVIGFPVRSASGLVALAVVIGATPTVIRSVMVPALRTATELAAAFE